MGHRKKAKKALKKQVRKLVRKHGSELVTALASALVGAAANALQPAEKGKKGRHDAEAVEAGLETGSGPEEESAPTFGGRSAAADGEAAAVHHPADREEHPRPAFVEAPPTPFYG